MRNLFFIIFLLLANINYCQEPGIKIADFKKKITGIIYSQSPCNQSIAVAEQIGAFNGNWFFSFIHDTLDNVFFTSNLDSAPTQKTIADVLAIKNVFIKSYGKPITDISKENFITENMESQNKSDTLLLTLFETKKCRIEIGLFYNTHNKKTTGSEEIINQHNSILPLNYYSFKINLKTKINNIAKSNYKFYPGMTVSQILTAVPQLVFSDVCNVSEYKKEETLYKLKGNWNYKFINSTLENSKWCYYSKDTKEKSYIECIEATKRIITNYKKKYGKPNAIFEDIEKRHEANIKQIDYNLMRAEWQLKNKTIIISVNCYSTKNDYSLVVLIEKNRKQIH